MGFLGRGRRAQARAGRRRLGVVRAGAARGARPPWRLGKLQSCCAKTIAAPSPWGRLVAGVREGRAGGGRAAPPFKGGSSGREARRHCNAPGGWRQPRPRAARSPRLEAGAARPAAGLGRPGCGATKLGALPARGRAGGLGLPGGPAGARVVQFAAGAEARRPEGPRLPPPAAQGRETREKRARRRGGAAAGRHSDLDCWQRVLLLARGARRRRAGGPPAGARLACRFRTGSGLSEAA
jgi:hypothetical protein